MKIIYSLLFIVMAILINHRVEGKVIEINAEKMTRTAGKIVAGRCTGIQEGFHPEYTNVKVTFVELDVIDAIKGSVGVRLKFMQFGHDNEISHAPRYKIGEEILLFLYPESQYGFTSPVGGYQGKLSIKTDPVSGKPAFVKVLNKGKLLKDVEIKEAEAIKDDISPAGNISGLIRYETFRQIIEAIINKL